MTTKFYLHLFYRIQLLLFFILGITSAITAQPIVSLTPVITTGLSAPLQFVNADDGSNRVFIVEKGGAVKVYDASFNSLGTYVTVSNVSTDGEHGLLSITFHPN